MSAASSDMIGPEELLHDSAHDYHKIIMTSKKLSVITVHCIITHHYFTTRSYVHIHMHMSWLNVVYCLVFCDIPQCSECSSVVSCYCLLFMFLFSKMPFA